MKMMITTVMNRLSVIVILIAFLSACATEVKEVQPTKTVKKIVKTNFEMYEVSEMTALMERFYANNQTIKKKILAGETDFGEFPNDYLTIHSAILTDSTDRDDFLNEQAQLFLEAQEKVYNEKDHQKENFNNMVNSCIECHKVKCSGPIERIKKLYIN